MGTTGGGHHEGEVPWGGAPDAGGLPRGSPPPHRYQWQLLDATASMTVIILATLPAALFFTSYSSFAYSIAKVYVVPPSRGIAQFTTHHPSPTQPLCPYLCPYLCLCLSLCPYLCVKAPLPPPSP